jgi:hypothetical protein|tara:strand:- start:190 stop:423 length:234 start_codon:yes stop_codon:yes gene_type:complete
MRNSKVRLVNDLGTQKIGEAATGFYSTKKVVGRSSKKATLSRLGLKQSVKPQSKFTMVNGVPCKMVNGVLVELKKVI